MKAQVGEQNHTHRVLVPPIPTLKGEEYLSGMDGFELMDGGGTWEDVHRLMAIAEQFL